MKHVLTSEGLYLLRRRGGTFEGEVVVNGKRRRIVAIHGSIELEAVTEDEQ